MNADEKLLLAADRLDELANAAFQGRREVIRYDARNGYQIAERMDFPDAELVAAMSPDLARAVAAWLRVTARVMGSPYSSHTAEKAALAVADLVLGTEAGE